MIHTKPEKGKATPTLRDRQGRHITYLRLAITDRCNLRCRYCMPERGVRFVPHAQVLRYEEMVRLVTIFTSLGVSKVRITGGEPFARRDCLPFLRKIRNISGLQELHLTTNGVAAAQHLDVLRELGINGINLSLDTLDRQRFRHLSGSDALDQVLATLHGALARNIPLKINTVVFQETLDEDILAVADLARLYPLTVRFIEKMPFSAGSSLPNGAAGQMRRRVEALIPSMCKVDNDLPSTATLFEVPGFTGRLGIIEGYSRTFCATCNKVLVTPLGLLKTCLYDNGVLDLKALLRARIDDETLRREIAAGVFNRQDNGLAAERLCVREQEPSMASIGG